jgi:hypothetical protein
MQTAERRLTAKLVKFFAVVARRVSSEISARLARDGSIARVGVSTLRKIARGSMITKDEADYVDHPVDGDQCIGCSMFIGPGACTLVKGAIAPDGHCHFWTGMMLDHTRPPRKLATTLKSSDHPGGADLHVKPENAIPISGVQVADVVTRANVQHVSWELVREGKFNPKPARIALSSIIATQQVVDRQRVAKHERELIAEGDGNVEPNAPPLVMLWDGDNFLLGGHHGIQAAYNLGVKVVGVMLVMT